MHMTANDSKIRPRVCLQACSLLASCWFYYNYFYISWLNTFLCGSRLSLFLTWYSPNCQSQHTCWTSTVTTSKSRTNNQQRSKYIFYTARIRERRLRPKTSFELICRIGATSLLPTTCALGCCSSHYFERIRKSCVVQRRSNLVWIKDPNHLPRLPTRPVRPMRWTYSSMSPGRSKLITCFTCGISSPRAAT